jgi:hypothetical protein
MTMKKHYRIVLAEPPTASKGRPFGSGAIQHFITRLLNEHPGQWALFDKNRKGLAYLYSLKKKTPGMEMRTVSNGNKTFQVYIKMNPVVETTGPAKAASAKPKASAKK